MIAGVADTHSAIWYVLKNPALSSGARQFMDAAASRGDEVAISAISLVEVVYLIEKNRLPASTYTDLRRALADPFYAITEVGLTGGVVEHLRLISRTEIPDMPDRVIAATGLFYNVPIISRDSKIRASRLITIW